MTNVGSNGSDDPSADPFNVGSILGPTLTKKPEIHA